MKKGFYRIKDKSQIKAVWDHYIMTEELPFDLLEEIPADLFESSEQFIAYNIPDDEFEPVFRRLYAIPIGHPLHK